MMAQNYRTTRYHTTQQHYCAIILSRVNTRKQQRQGSSLCRHCFHSRYYGTATPYRALFFLPFFPHQRSSSPTCMKPWSLCWSHRTVLRRGCTMFKAEHSADHNREDTQGLRNDAHCKAHKGGYCVASSLTGYCLKRFEANNEKSHSILYMHQPLYWYIDAMEHSRLSEYSTGDFEVCKHTPG